ncbi:9245_t:CDS:2 [Paraglomus occultum]|uniref:9245_t:CDS:1 n=1 Tax=Paraglomus occultum TaxID=144539 RepID=A0A9N8VLE6_9GLOM|nr:9245_t:CDS:2 [Paraglomus occultum]
MTKVQTDSSSSASKKKRDLSDLDTRLGFLSATQPEKHPRIIRLDVPLLQPDNNVVYFPDLLREEGLEPPTPMKKFPSGSDTPVSGSDATPPPSPGSKTPDHSLPLPADSPFGSPLASGTHESDAFFNRLLENAERREKDERAKAESEKPQKKRPRTEMYDMSDPFIDDSDLVPSQRQARKVRPKLDGFFVWKGPLTKNDLEMLDGEGKPKRRVRTKCINSPEESKQPRPRKRVSKKADSTISEHKLATPSPCKQKRDKSSTDPEKKTQSLITKFVSTAGGGSQNQTGETIIDFGEPSTPVVQAEVMKTSGKKKKTYVVESLPLELQSAIELFKDAITKESFEVKSKFPVNLKPTLLIATAKAYDMGLFNENFFKTLTNLLPYNKFTVTRLCKRTLFPMKIQELEQAKEQLIADLKIAIDTTIPNLIKRYNEQKAGSFRSENSFNSDGCGNSPSRTVTPTPPNGNTTHNGTHNAMSVDAIIDNDVNDIDADAGEGSDDRSDGFGKVSKKFKWDDATKSLLWKVIKIEMDLTAMQNELNEAEEKSERLSEQTMRKRLYQRLLSFWPSGWITSYDISRVYSAFKRKLKVNNEQGSDRT